MASVWPKCVCKYLHVYLLGHAFLCNVINNITVTFQKDKNGQVGTVNVYKEQTGDSKKGNLEHLKFIGRAVTRLFRSHDQLYECLEMYHFLSLLFVCSCYIFYTL